MFLSPLKILESTLVLVLLLPAFGSSVAFGQQQDRNSVRLEVPRVTLLVSPTSIAPGQRLRLVAHLSSGYPNIRFRFAFGDGTQSQWQTSTVTTHTYQAAGNYLPFVDIGMATGAGVTRLGGSPRRPIRVTATLLSSDPTNRDFRQPASSRRSAKKGRADASNSTSKTLVKESETPPEAVAPPPSSPEIAASSPIPGSALPFPTPSPTLSSSLDSPETSHSAVSTERGSGDWWKYLLIALPVVLLAFVVGKRYLAPGPTIRTVRDPGTASVTDATRLILDSRADQRSNVLHGEHLVSTDDGSLVKNVRSENV